MQKNKKTGRGQKWAKKGALHIYLYNTFYYTLCFKAGLQKMNVSTLQIRVLLTGVTVSKCSIIAWQCL